MQGTINYKECQADQKKPNQTKPKIPRNENDTKIENLMERFSNRLDPAEEGISELKARFTEIIQNAVQRQTNRQKKIKQWFKDMGNRVRKSKILLTKVSEENKE